MASMRPTQVQPELACITEPIETVCSQNQSVDEDRRFPNQPVSPDRLRDALASELEAEIIPRLLLAHCTQSDFHIDASASPTILDRTVQIRELTRIALHSEVSAVTAFVEALVCAKMPLDKVLVDVVAGSARYMGRLWEADELDFVEVTIGVSRLQQALRILTAERKQIPKNSAARAYSAAFAPVQGEQHSFGLILVGESFRHAGWRVTACPEFDSNDMAAAAAEEPLDLAGFSLSCERRLDQLGEEIENLRLSSCSSDLVILVGGNVFLDNPELWKSTGADGMALDAIQAIRIGENLVNGRQGRRQSKQA
jgi:MerR family transcriptional regulator, light-induced transcriptional regulator